MTVKAAVDRLATWTPTGISVWNFDEIMIPPPETDLPICFPRMGSVGGEGMRSLGVAQNAGQVVIRLVHVLVLRGLGMGEYGEAFYGDITHVDNYLAAVADDLNLNGNLLEALSIPDVVWGIQDLGGGLFWGVEFHHRWLIKVT